MGENAGLYEACNIAKLGLDRATPVVTLVAKRPGGASVAGRCETSQRRGYQVGQVSHDAHELLLSVQTCQSLQDLWQRGMKSATTKDLQEFKRVGPYLRGRPVGAIVFEPQTLLGVLDVFCDADHAGDLGTRRSRSGMAVMW